MEDVQSFIYKTSELLGDYSLQNVCLPPHAFIAVDNCHTYVSLNDRCTGSTFSHSWRILCAERMFEDAAIRYNSYRKRFELPPAMFLICNTLLWHIFPMPGPTIPYMQSYLPVRAFDYPCIGCAAKLIRLSRRESQEKRDMWLHDINVQTGRRFAFKSNRTAAYRQLHPFADGRSTYTARGKENVCAPNK
jgi:hypothetical protein